MIETGIAASMVAVLSEFGIIGGLFAIIVVAIVYISIKYIPKAVDAHFNAIDKMHDKFSSNLETISNKFVASIDTLSREHEKHYDKLNDIHNDVKKLNK